MNNVLLNVYVLSDMLWQNIGIGFLKILISVQQRPLNWHIKTRISTSTTNGNFCNNDSGQTIWKTSPFVKKLSI